MSRRALNRFTNAIWARFDERDLAPLRGPDELDAIEALTHKHWERASLRELRGAIER